MLSHEGPKAESAGNCRNTGIALAALIACLVGGGRCPPAPAADAPGSESAERAAALYGKPEVMKFKDGKLGAFSMQFDDSIDSQATVAIPLLNARGLAGTFFVNPGAPYFWKNRKTWETCPKFGHELADHTMHHTNAKDLKEADYEMGECARVLRQLCPNQTGLMPFVKGGGTVWRISDEQMQQLMDKHLLYRSPRTGAFSDEKSRGEDLIAFARRAIEQRAWAQLVFHGVGGGWIRTSKEAFVTLLDYLVANRDKLWIANTSDPYRYQQEYEAIDRVSLADPTEAGFQVAIECDETKVNTRGRPFTELYNQPLTVRVGVPDSWSRFCVVQGDAVQSGATVEAEGRRYAQFDIRPNVGPAAISRSLWNEEMPQ